MRFRACIDLRHAFVVAGVETVVISVWKFNDEATETLTADGLALFPLCIFPSPAKRAH